MQGNNNITTRLRVWENGKTTKALEKPHQPAWEVTKLRGGTLGRQNKTKKKDGP